jgi:uncharacterized membrane protein YgaE (UPF0421/DUF939 family)
MDNESYVFGSLTVGVVVGLAILIAGVEGLGNVALAGGGVIAVGCVLLMAWYISNL